MKRIILILLCTLLISPSAIAFDSSRLHKLEIFNTFNTDAREIKSLLNSQVKYANRANFDKFIATYDKNYINSDGFNLEVYSNIIKDVWNTYSNIVYGIKIKDIRINEDSAEVDLVETSNADIALTPKMTGVLKSESSSVYYLKKCDGVWKVSSEKVLTEDTTMLYGEARNLNIKLNAPNEIKPGEEYTATLEFNPPKDVIAIASIASDIVEYPQRQPKEVYRRLPDDNILERLFVSNKKNLNEFVVASIGLTKADIEDLSIKLSLTGFGYKIVRVNVLPEVSEADNVKDK